MPPRQRSRFDEQKAQASQAARAGLATWKFIAVDRTHTTRLICIASIVRVGSCLCLGAGAPWCPSEPRLKSRVCGLAP